MNPPAERVVIKSTIVRDTVVGALCVLGILAVLFYGMAHVGDKPKGNILTGEIVEKQFTPLKEQLIEFKGRHLTAARESEGEYVLKVRVDSEGGRIFEVPVNQYTYETKKVGESQSFVRPRSEQK